jgi:CDP-glucose 4,6-dehydratase
MFDHIFKNKTVLVTGHTGFKGSWLCIWLQTLGAKVIGYALAPYTHRDNFVVSDLKKRMDNVFGDIRDGVQLLGIFEKYQPEFVFHLAAQALVGTSYRHPKETFDINVAGAVNVLEACRLTDSVRVIVNVTSDKCYENREWVYGYRENDALGGHDPYSASKACSELITNTYRRSFFSLSQHGAALSSVRAGNVIGGGDWQKDRIIPDCIKALEGNRPVAVRNPHAIRPWQHVLDPLAGYLLLASKMYQNPTGFCGAWNFGPHHYASVSVGEVVDMVVTEWGGGAWEDVSADQKVHEATLLNLDISKSVSFLGWQPRWDIRTAVERTVGWYRQCQHDDPYDLCLQQIEAYSTRGN